MAKFSGEVLGAAIFAPEFATYGALGGLTRFVGGSVGSAVGGYAGAEIGKALDDKFRTNFFTPVLGIAGGLKG